VFYLHGGGYVGHATEQHWRFAGRLAEAATARVIVVQYPIAPAHTWRDAHAAVLEVYRKVAAEVDHELTLLGDSAGGGLALALAQRLVAAGEPLPAKLVVYTPWGDLALDLSQPEHDPWMSKPYLAMAGRLWAGGDPTDLPELSPLFGDFTGLPPMLVVCGTKDLSLPQARAIVGKARAAGVPTTYIEGRGLLHDYPVLNLPEGRKAIRQTAEFLRNS
jgi:acetyl esterase/lipase